MPGLCNRIEPAMIAVNGDVHSHGVRCLLYDETAVQQTNGSQFQPVVRQ
jgi:hypothetical protein